MAVAVLGLAGLFLALYLLLYHLGYYGALVCGEGGSCEYVQASRFARFLGQPVAGWGVAWYALVLTTALLGIQPALAERRWLGTILSLLAVGGFAFTLYLTSTELFILHAICRWCVGSAIIATLIFVLVAWDWGRRSGSGTGEMGMGGVEEEG
jgi:uncharacterized membrane protein